MVQIAQVIIDHYHVRLDRLFDYLIPHELIENVHPGMRVEVPFGRQNKRTEAYVIRIMEMDHCEDHVKCIARVLDNEPVLSSEQIEIVGRLKKKYMCRTIEAIKCFVPHRNVAEKEISWIILDEKTDARALANGTGYNRAPTQKKVLQQLSENPEMPLRTLLKMTDASHTSIKTMEKKELIRIEKRRTRRDPFSKMLVADYPEPALSGKQKQALEEIKRHWKDHSDQEVLLHGITGSGKTEVYLRLIKETLDKDLDSIVLVPEIALTPQMVQRFRGRFGDRIAVLHSHLSEGEKKDE